ncbi:MAG: FtsL-like putative cell division protein [Bacteroidetes bacterium]|nr:FtsL-like putative cell division protein [Bacteroidota bacterium]
MAEFRVNKMRENPVETDWKDISYASLPQEEAAEPIKEAETKTSPEAKPAKKSHKGRRRVQDVLGGDYLLKKSVVDNVPFLIYLTVLALFYIANTYNTERMYKQIEKTKAELKELRFEYITARSSLMFESKLSELNKRTQAIGLRETLIPPYKIFYSGDSIQIGNR